MPKRLKGGYTITLKQFTVDRTQFRYLEASGEFVTFNDDNIRTEYVAAFVYVINNGMC